MMSSTALPTEMDAAIPSTYGEEELQLQLALAISREEAEAEERKKKEKSGGRSGNEGGEGRNVRDDEEGESNESSSDRPQQQQQQQQQQPASASLLDLDPWGDSTGDANPNAIVNSPSIHRAANTWGNSKVDTPFGGGGGGGVRGSAGNDPWQMSPLDAPKPPPASYAAAAATLPPTAAPPASDDAWNALKNGNALNGAGNGVFGGKDAFSGNNSGTPSGVVGAFNMDGFKLELDDPFTVKTTAPSVTAASLASPLSITRPLGIGLTPSLTSPEAGNGDAFGLSTSEGASSSSSAVAKSKSPEASFLGVNSSLVNLDSLLSLKKTADPESGSAGGGGGGGGAAGANPFALTPSGVGIKSSPTPPNPFAAAVPKGPPMNQLKNNAGGTNNFLANNNNNNAGSLGVNNNNSFGSFPSNATSAAPLMPMMNSASFSTGNNANVGFPSSLLQQQPFPSQQSFSSQQQQLQRPNEDPNPFLL